MWGWKGAAISITTMVGCYSIEMGRDGSLKDVRYKHPLHTVSDFSVTTPRCYKDLYVNRFFPHSKSSVNRHLLSLGSF